MIDFNQRLQTFAMGESAWQEWLELIQQTPEADLMRRAIDEHMEHVGDLHRSGALASGEQAFILTEIKGTTLALLDVWHDQREAWLVSQAAGRRISSRLLGILQGRSALHAAE